MAFRFIHASDLHIGRKFATIPQPPEWQHPGPLDGSPTRHDRTAGAGRA